MQLLLMVDKIHPTVEYDIEIFYSIVDKKKVTKIIPTFKDEK